MSEHEEAKPTGSAWVKRTRALAERAANNFYDDDVSLLIGSVAASSVEMEIRRSLAGELVESEYEPVRAALADLAIQMAVNGDEFAGEIADMLRQDPAGSIQSDSTFIIDLLYARASSCRDSLAN